MPTEDASAYSPNDSESAFAKVNRWIEDAQKNRVTELDLSRENLRELPKSLGELTDLRKLFLYGNQLTELPEWFCRLINLRELNLSNNPLDRLPESFGQLTYLERLYLSTTHLELLPESIGNLRCLRKLDLSETRLRKLPESFGKLTELQQLDLSTTYLLDLPDSFGDLNQLVELDASNASLKKLPDSLGKLANLTELYLVNNQLTELPESLWNLSSLRQLRIEGNSTLGLPADVLMKSVGDMDWRASPREILEYYFRLRDGKRPLNEAKLILVGRGGVGKTSVVNRLIHNRFKDERKTEGIRITKWKIVLPDDVSVRLNVWDFGGQEIMHATHQFFLTQRSLYLLVLSGREGGEDADAEYWLKLIESFGGDSPVIVVLNKIKEHPFDVNRRALQQKYPNIRRFIGTDCSTRTGIEELESAINSETAELRHVRDAFPASWFRIKDSLAAMEKNFLSFDQYRGICSKLGEKDTTAQESLALYLHSLGVALNFRDDPRLQDTHVLNPRWVTNGIYTILNSYKLEKQKGEIWLSDLSKVLDVRRYPSHMHRFLFDLMKKFELCFSFPEDETRYLIPELLDKQQPVEADEFVPNQCLNFQYHYPALPEGLLPRFIVRTHNLSEGLPRWRTGVIMEFEGCRALVKADVQDRKVFISVSGPVSYRRRLLAVIRSDFERIHRDIRNLQPWEMVSLPEHPTFVVPYEKLLALEREGIVMFPEYVDGKMIDVGVKVLLNGIDLSDVRKRQRKWEKDSRALRLFYSYSHKDDSWRNELETHLKLLQRQGLIETWHDRKINPGDEFDKKIDENLERADIILLLVSSDFVASDYCYEKEMKRALERHNDGHAKVVPVIVRDVNWKKAPFAKLSALPKDGKAVELWDHRDSAWRNVSEGIERVVEEIQESRTR